MLLSVGDLSSMARLLLIIRRALGHNGTHHLGLTISLGQRYLHPSFKSKTKCTSVLLCLDVQFPRTFVGTGSYVMANC